MSPCPECPEKIPTVRNSGPPDGRRHLILPVLKSQSHLIDSGHGIKDRDACTYRGRAIREKTPVSHVNVRATQMDVTKTNDADE
ncbi:MAG: hypothetical protein GDA39_09340 [Hyphomonadaceae bacterium]|nr:hypothetical protein [Hyphomonadaceae bacterium]MBC6413043.1 hypothetical protein [Hyphomonadaceae bacterium]